jgi:hypothetical protein
MFFLQVEHKQSISFINFTTLILLKFSGFPDFKLKSGINRKFLLNYVKHNKIEQSHKSSSIPNMQTDRDLGILISIYEINFCRLSIPLTLNTDAGYGIN